MRRLISLFLIVSFLLALSGCSLQNTVLIETTTVPTQAQCTTEPTETTAPQPVKHPLFSEQALVNQPAAITEQERMEINNELNDILSRKNYDETGKELIRDTITLLCSNYPNFEYLFSFLNPPDTATYLRENILTPLDTMVDTLTCTRYGTGGGSASDSTKEICVDLIGSEEWGCMTLIHELNHMVTARDHCIVSSNIYRYISEGDATLHQLTIIGGMQYRNVGDVQDNSRRHFSPDNDTLCMQVGGFGGGNYSDFSLLYFKLLALTDFETMTLFDQPAGEFLIREALGEKYGEDGLALFDSLTPELDYEAVLRTESLFLKLFLSRLSEVESADQMLSYLFLYRLYRMVFAPEYLRIEADLIQELPHPELDYSTADEAVANAVVRWGILNTEGLSKEEGKLVALVMSGRTQTASSEAYWERHEREFYHPLNPFLLCEAWYTCEEDITVTYMSELPDGYQIYYFETELAGNLHAMAEAGLLNP